MKTEDRVARNKKKNELDETRGRDLWKENAMLKRKIQRQHEKLASLQNAEILLEEEKANKRQYQVRVAGVERSWRKLQELGRKHHHGPAATN